MKILTVYVPVVEFVNSDTGDRTLGAARRIRRGLAKLDFEFRFSSDSV